MSTKETATVSTISKASLRRAVKVCVCLLAALAIVAAAVTVGWVLDARDRQAQADSLAEQIAALESQVSDLEAGRQDTSSRLEEQEGTISDQQQQLEAKDKELKDRDKTISDLKAQIALKKGSTTTKKTTKAALVKTTVPYNGDGSGKLIALTFDDGPGPYTARLLDAMKKRGVRATFFVMGSKVDSNKALIKRMEAEGHVVGSHTQNHKNLATLSSAGVKKELDETAKRLEKILGHKPTLVRPPYGSYNNTVKSCAKKAKVSLIQWSVDTRDWESRNVNSIMNQSFRKGAYGIQDGAIVLMHDIYSTTVDAAIKMMDRLAKEGYTMVTVPELLTARQGGATPGAVYYSAFP